MSFPFARILAGARLSFGGDRDYWHPRLAPTGATSVGADAPYPLDFEAKADHPGPFDPSGIPLTRYGGNVGDRLYPIDIAQFGLAHLARFRRTGSEASRLQALKVADWILGHLRPGPGSPEPAWLLTEFDWGASKAPWPSGMAQGQAASVLIRAYGLTRDTRYLEAARRAVMVLEVSVDDGGVARKLGGIRVFEEVPARSLSGILNGHLFACYGLADIAAELPHEPVLGRLHDQSISDLGALIPRYDLGFWSRYDLSDGWPPRVASAFYHELHVHQIQAIDALYPRLGLLPIANRWNRQLTSLPFRLAAFVAKGASSLLRR